MIPVSICVIAKNEEKNLPNLLSSLQEKLAPFSGEYEIRITDTGSTDRTVEIAESYGCKIDHFVWCNDFSAARNYAISKAIYDQILFLDADEIPESFDWTETQNLLSKYPHAVGCFLRRSLCPCGEETVILTDEVERLFHRDFYHYECRIHEQLTANDRSNLLVYNFPLTVYHEGYMGTKEELAKKAQRNNELLFQQLEEEPDSPYTLYQIAKSFGLIGDTKQQYDYFVKAYSLRPNPQYSYYSDLITGLGHSMLALEKKEEALQLFAEEYDVLKHIADFLCFGGAMYISLGMLVEAIQQYKQALLCDKYFIEGMNSKIPHHNLGCIYEALENEAKAMEHFYLADNHPGSKERYDALIQTKTEEQIYYPKISVIIPITNNQKLHLPSIWDCLENQTIGICHQQILFVGNWSNQENIELQIQLAEYEKYNPHSVVLLQLDDEYPEEELIDTALSYITSEYIYIYNSSQILHYDALRQLRSTVLQEDCDLVAYDIQFSDIDSFVINLDSEATKSELIRSDLLKKTLNNKIFATTFLSANNLCYQDLINYHYLNFAKRIFCYKENFLI